MAVAFVIAVSVHGARGVDFGPLTTLQGGIGFTTAIEFGPEDPDPSSTADGCVYALNGQTGEVHRVCFDATKLVTSDTIVIDLGGASGVTHALGLVFDPISDPASEIQLYVSFATDGTAPFNGGIARAVSVDGGVTYTVDEAFITGLPRAEDPPGTNQTNGLSFGPDGCLYIAQGSNSNSGYSSGFAESRLSGTITRACFKSPGGAVDPAFDRNCGGAGLQESCGLEVYASGFRNPYDLVWHSNGLLYSTDNDASLGFGLDCGTEANNFGCACQEPSVAPIGDELNLVEQGLYYGSPNPYLAMPTGLQCQGGTNAGDFCTLDADCPGGSCLDLSALCTDGLCGDIAQCFYFGFGEPPLTGEDPNGVYRTPISQTTAGLEGLTEYRSRFSNLFDTSFCSDWDGQLLATGGPGDLRRLSLSADGRSAIDEGITNLSLATGLDTVVGQDGTIYVADFTTGSITFVSPIEQTDPNLPNFFITNCTTGHLFSDNFDRDSLGSDWVVDAESFAIVSNELVENSGNSLVDAQMRYVGGVTTSADQFGKLRITDRQTHTWGFIFRTSGPTSDHYEIHSPVGTSGWRWERYNPAFAARLGECVGDFPASNGDYIGATVDGTGINTVVSVWRWTIDPDFGGPVDITNNWGPPDCVIQNVAGPYVDAGTAVGLRAYTGSSSARAAMDDWVTGDISAATGPVTGPCGQQITQIIDESGAGAPASRIVDPDGLIVDPEGNVYVAACGLSPSTEGVFKVTPDGVITKVAGGDGDGTNPMTCPVGLGLDSSGNLYAAAFLSNNAFKITPDGVITQIIGPSGDGTNSLSFAIDIAVDFLDNVYVTGNGSASVFRITPVGAITQIIGPGGDGTNPLLSPFGVTTDPSGNVYVAGFGTDNVFRITDAGVITQIMDSTGDGLGALLDAPHDIASDAAGNIFLTGNRSDNVFKIATNGVITEILSPAGDGDGNILDNPTGLAVDNLGNVFVAAFDSANGFKIAADGTVTQILDSLGDGVNGFSMPSDFCVAVDNNSNVFMAGTKTDNVYKINIFSVSCGDGVVDSCEVCDDGGETATCNADCTLPVCGDGILNTASGEECELGIACPGGQSCRSCFCGEFVCDDFNRPTLGPSWVADNLSFSIVGNKLNQGSGAIFAPGQLRWADSTTDTVDQFGKLQVFNTNTDSWGFMFRINGMPGEHYEVHAPGSGDIWRWERYNPSFVASMGTCVGDMPMADGDYIGAKITGTGSSTKLSIWRWSVDPDSGGMVNILDNWGAPDCTIDGIVGPFVDTGTSFGIRSYAGSSTAPEVSDNWCGGDVSAVSGSAFCISDADCDDGDFCNGMEICDQSVGCLPGTPETCDDSNPCTDDSCSQISGCLNVANASTCDDGLTCTAGDACVAGVCTGTDTCMVGEVCNVLSGTCQPPIIGQSFCDDFNRLLLGSDWVADNLSFSIASNRVIQNSGQITQAGQLRWAGGDADSIDQFGKIQVFSTQVDSYGFMFRANGTPGEHYEVHLPGSTATWRWERYNPLWIEIKAMCVGDMTLADGDYIGATIEGTGLTTKVSVWRWDIDPDGGGAVNIMGNWGTPDCTMEGVAAPYVDTGLSFGTRSYAGSSPAIEIADNWCGGDISAAVGLGECFSNADCNDGNICTDDICDLMTGCEHTNNVASCDDGVACTGSDTCAAGVCTGVDSCAVGSTCDLATGLCALPPSGQTFCDNFDRVALGSNWAVDNLSFSIAAGQLVENSGATFAPGQLRWIGGLTDTPDQFGKIQVFNTQEDAYGFMLRINGLPGAHYEVHLASNSTMWRWERYDPLYVETKATCMGDVALSDGDYVGVKIEGAGLATKVSVWRWDVDPDGAGMVNINGNWGPPDCTMEGVPPPYVDPGRSTGTRSYAGPSNADEVADNWCGGDVIAVTPTCTVDADCNDGDLCNGTETCGGMGECQPGTPLVCDDNDICNGVETCDITLGCQFPASLDCDDLDACTDDTCDAIAGCMHSANVASCDDGIACTTGDVCAGGVCSGADSCTLPDRCDPFSGLCAALPPGQTFCDDFNRTLLGPNWVADSLTFSIDANQLIEDSGDVFTHAELRWVGGTTDTIDQFGKIQVFGDQVFGMMFRLNGAPGEHYEVHIRGGQQSWQWERYNPAFLEVKATCLGDFALASGDYVGATISGTGINTVVSVWRWDTDPDTGGAVDITNNWGAADCVMQAVAAPYVDTGVSTGIRASAGALPDPEVGDNWCGGDLSGGNGPP